MSDGSVAERPLRPSTRGSLAGAPEREEKHMSVPNIGPEPFDLTEHDGTDIPRRGNPALVYRDERLPDGMEAATTRATTVSHRFGGVRYALTRNDGIHPSSPTPDDGGDPHGSH